MNNKCYCGNCVDDDNKSRAMYSIDYDSLIEKLEDTRDELDSVIKILRNKKEKDNVINTILSEEYDDSLDNQNDDDRLDAIVNLLRTMQKQQYPYRWYYPWNNVTYTGNKTPKTYYKF